MLDSVFGIFFGKFSESVALVLMCACRNSEHAASEVSKYRLHALVVGPGLGRDEHVQSNVKTIVENARKDSLPMVFDADGVALILKYPDLVKGYKQAVLTPNKAEFARLCDKFVGKEPSSFGSEIEAVKGLSQALGNATVVCKGSTDIISNGEEYLMCDLEGSLRRCGGQGDVLSGSLGTLLYWSCSAKMDPHSEVKGLLDRLGPCLTAAYASCALTRHSANLAFIQHGRSMTAPNLIEKIHPAFVQIFQQTN